MKRRILFLLAGLGLNAYPQTWSSFLDPSRAIDWTGVGFTIPNYNAPCNSQPTLTANDPTAATANTTAIQNALASCDATHNVVNISAGTYYVAGWTYPATGNVVVRGSGPRSTTILLTDTPSCYGNYPGICMTSNPYYYGNSSLVLPPSGTAQCLWTGGFTQGTTTITLNTCPNNAGPPVNKTLFLDQANDSTDTGGVYLCDSYTGQTCVYKTPTNADGRLISGVTHSQKQAVTVTGISGRGTGPYTVTISPGVYFTNIRVHPEYNPANCTAPVGTCNTSNQYPGAYWPGFVKNDGLENLTIDQNTFYLQVTSTVGFTIGGYVRGLTSGATAWIVGVNSSRSYLNLRQGQGTFVVSETLAETLTAGGATTSASTTNLTSTGQFGLSLSVGMFGCYQCWVKNVRSLWATRDHVVATQSLNNVIRNNYFFGSQSQSSESYGFEEESSSNTLLENNIFQQVTTPVMFGQGSGSVVGYNYSINNPFGPSGYAGMMLSYYGHNAGNEMNLWEGNNFNGVMVDGTTWGSSTTGTIFRNMLSGWQTGKTLYTFPVNLASWTRAFNFVGNVLGQPGYHSNYESYPASTNGGSAGWKAIYNIGWIGGNGNCVSPPTCDVLVRPTLMRWGNYDTVTSGTNWNSTEASPAAVPYVNANFTSSYFSSLAQSLPASLYYINRPSWWPAGKAWPPVGPDVSSGNLGICSGTYAGAQATASSQCTGGSWSSAWAAHANSIPAQDCYLNVMGGPPDGSGNILNFDANLCYATPASPTGLTVTVH